MEGYFYSPETVCPSCGANRPRSIRFPEHVRVWMQDDSTEVTEHMPPSIDRKCENCDHQWTDYPNPL